MDEDGRLERFLRAKLRSAGEQVGQAQDAYRRAKHAAAVDLPVDDEGNARLVCRRYAERRAVPVDGDGKPSCFEGGHPDCEGCLEDIRDGRIETW
ncbi:DUF7091 family protein [Halapricum hydrolyticum]|uniref:Uncharacterized protein n=1 Tax=Halapricum hydrolyticum TaxID=2979991 RepID=A0AAE3ICY7_9EURY|nr:hypothetical protein [Halapricum hydrolyticum]MCU4719199.1 hypothetical protein [Halapricum hydrolyticum]MCU4728290.1 hypothetical protein [Halapricum hydrolyticum]